MSPVSSHFSGPEGNSDEPPPESPDCMPQGRDDASMLSLVTHYEPGHNVDPGQFLMQQKCPSVTLGPMNTIALSTRRPRGINPKGAKLQQLPRGNGYKLPEYPDLVEVNACFDQIHWRWCQC